jgi:hypothetical protein
MLNLPISLLKHETFLARVVDSLGQFRNDPSKQANGTSYLAQWPPISGKIAPISGLTRQPIRAGTWQSYKSESKIVGSLWALRCAAD